MKRKAGSKYSELELMIIAWEGGEIVDTNLLLRLLIAELRESRLRASINPDDVI